MGRRLKALLERFLRSLSPGGSRRGPATTRPKAKPKRTGAPTRPTTPGRGVPTAPPDGQVSLPDTNLRNVTIEYDPRMDGDPDPGEVVWAWVPYEDDPMQGKDRPVVIIGHAGEFLAGLALTSKDHDRPDHFPLGPGKWDRDGRTSFAKLDRVLRIDASRVRREGAVLEARRFHELVDALRSFQ